MKHIKKELTSFDLFKEISASALSFFRIGFGVILLLEAIRIGKMISYYSSLDISFKYRFFRWVEILPQAQLELLQYSMILLSICIILGFLYRMAIIGFFLGYTYFFLLEVSLYNNHYYLMILLLFLAIFVNANQQFSVDRFIFKKKKRCIPFWHIWIFRFQIVLVYFSAGLVKINMDWMTGKVMRQTLYYGTDFVNRPFLGARQNAV